MTLINKVAAEDLFQGLNPEDEQAKDRRAEFIGGGLAKIVEGFETLLEKISLDRHELEYEYYLALEVSPRDCSAIDIEKFSQILPMFEGRSVRTGDLAEDYFGYYLSAVTSFAKDNRIVIHTAHLKKAPEAIGIGNDGKSIIVRGSVGAQIGNDMRAGIIIVNGDIEGDACNDMHGGCVLVRGNVNAFKHYDDGIGHLAKGGTLRVMGEFYGRVNDWKDNCRGNPEIAKSYKRGLTVYHRGELIMKDGERI